MNNKKILITGGLGFIFSHVVEYFASKGNYVSVVDNISDGSHPVLLKKWDDNIEICIRDINHIESLGERDFDFIIHAAAESNVDKSIEKSKAFILSNINGTFSMLEYAKCFCPNLKGFLYVGTDEVYGSNKIWVDSNFRLNPTNPYSASKAAAGHLCWSYFYTHNLPVQEIRMCNIIGKRQATTKLLPRVINCLENDKEIPVYDGGSFTREYMDVRNVSPLIEDVLSSGKNEIFNLTYNQELSINQVIETAAKILGKKPKTIPSSRKGHDKHYRMLPHLIMKKGDEWAHDHYIFEETVKWMIG